MQQFNRSMQFTKEGGRESRSTSPIEGWLADYADPFDFINVLLDGANLQDSGNNNFAYFTDPKYRADKAAANKSGDPRATAYPSSTPTSTKTRSRGPPLERQRARLLLGQGRVPGVPADLHHGPRALPALVI